MKTKLLMVAFMMVMVMGCHKTNQCDHVSPYAPYEISWTDYNSLDSVREYFDCHDSTLLHHYQDTIMVKGYFVVREKSPLWFRGSATDQDTSNWVMLVGGPERTELLDTTRMAKVKFLLHTPIPYLYPAYPHKDNECCYWPWHLSYIYNTEVIYEDIKK